MEYVSVNIRYLKYFLLINILGSPWNKAIPKPQPLDDITINIIENKMYPEPIPKEIPPIEDESDYGTQEKTQIDRVMDKSSEKFCTELRFKEPESFSKKPTKNNIFKFLNVTDISGFPMYFNEVDEQYMIHRPLVDHNSRYYNGNGEEEDIGKLTEYTFVNGSHTQDFASIAPSITLFPNHLSHNLKPYYTNLKNKSKEYGSRNTAVCHKRKTKGRGCSAVWSGWLLTDGILVNATSFECGVTIRILKSHVNTFFQCIAFPLAGYMGVLQENARSSHPSGGAVIMSLWDSGAGNKVKEVYTNKKEGVTNNFHNAEGALRQARFGYPWEIGHHISLKVKANMNKTSKVWHVEGHIKYGKGDFAKKENIDVEGSGNSGHKGARYNGPEGPVNVETHEGDYMSMTDTWIHFVTFSKIDEEYPQGEGFAQFIEDIYSIPGYQGQLIQRAAEWTDPYFIIEGKRAKLRPPMFWGRSTGFWENQTEWITQREIGPPDSGNIYMSCGKPND